MTAQRQYRLARPTRSSGYCHRGSGYAFALAFWALLSLAPAAQAVPQIGYAPTVVREVTGTIGEITRTIVVDSDVFQDEVVSTGANSATRIIFKDGTNLVLGENSKLKLTKLIFDPDPAKSKVAIEATLGIFRWTSGTLPSKSYQISTPVSTIGVRGTVIEFAVTGIGSTTVAVVQGMAEVANLRNQSVLLHPGQATVVLTAPVGGEPPPPSPPGPPPSDFLEAARQMTIMVRMADPPSDVNPAAGPGGQQPAVPITFTGPGGGNGHQNDPGGSNGSGIGAFGNSDLFARTLNTPPPAPPGNQGDKGNQGGQGNPGSQGNQGDPNSNDNSGGVGGDTGKPEGAKAANQIASTNAPATRIGTQSTASITVSRSATGGDTGDLGRLTGTVGPGGAPFTGAGSGPNGVDIGVGQSASFNYVFAPTTHGFQEGSVNFSFTDSAGDGTPLGGTVALNGVGVGPQFASDAAGGALAFGTMRSGTTRTLSLAISNLTTDEGSIDLVGLTLLGFKISGTWASLFSLDNFVDGQVLDKGETVLLRLTYHAPDDPGFFDDAMLTLITDQGAAFGSFGDTFSFALSGGVEVPEPTSIGIFALAASIGLALRRRRRS